MDKRDWERNVGESMDGQVKAVISTLWFIVQPGSRAALGSAGIA
jgi:hypothetical protein